jgi:hypothetical protein
MIKGNQCFCNAFKFMDLVPNVITILNHLFMVHQHIMVIMHVNEKKTFVLFYMYVSKPLFSNLYLVKKKKQTLESLTIVI